MSSRRSWLAGALVAVAWIVGLAPDLRAQGVEISPFYGYRFGGGFFEIETGSPVDTDGAPALGVVVDVPIGNGLAVEGLFTHQKADIFVPAGTLGPAHTWAISVDHWEGGATQEFDYGAVRPFLTSLFGLTHFAADADNEIRFTMGVGGGVKVFPVRSVGVRLDSRVFATFADASGSGFACTPTRGCLVAVHLHVVWQAEFAAALVFRIR